MKNFSFLMLGIMSSVSFNTAHSKPRVHVRTQTAHPLFERLRITEEKGQMPKSLAQVGQGRPVLVILWAPWCSPCMSEFPSVERLSQKGLPFKVLPVSIDAPSGVDGFCLSSITVPLWYVSGGQQILDEEKINSIPTALLFSAQGKLLWRVSGAKEWDSPESIAEIHAKLGATSSATQAVPKQRKNHRRSRRKAK
jgi:thiol-disulfide isomerase/thioredoxin